MWKHPLWFADISPAKLAKVYFDLWQFRWHRKLKMNKLMNNKHLFGAQVRVNKPELWNMGRVVGGRYSNCKVFYSTIWYRGVNEFILTFHIVSYTASISSFIA